MSALHTSALLERFDEVGAGRAAVVGAWKRFDSRGDVTREAAQPAQDAAARRYFRRPVVVEVSDRHAVGDLEVAVVVGEHGREHVGVLHVRTARRPLIGDADRAVPGGGIEDAAER
jgi:hypothetical protein